jgi:lipid-A-disaccharide synthase
MLAKRAMVVGYKVAPLTYRIVKAFGMLKVDRYALPNVLAGSDVAPELMQEDCTPENLAAAVLNQFQHPEITGALQPRYREIHEALRQDASARAAETIAGLLPKDAGP